MKFINLPYGGQGAKFDSGLLIDHIKSSGRDYIIQGQTHETLSNHKKPHSLDYWLRIRFTENRDTNQATNEVIDQLVDTGVFVIEGKLLCPDSGRNCKGIKLRS